MKSSKNNLTGVDTTDTQLTAKRLWFVTSDDARSDAGVYLFGMRISDLKNNKINYG